MQMFSSSRKTEPAAPMAPTRTAATTGSETEPDAQRRDRHQQRRNAIERSLDQGHGEIPKGTAD